MVVSKVVKGGMACKAGLKAGLRVSGTFANEEGGGEFSIAATDLNQVSRVLQMAIGRVEITARAVDDNADTSQQLVTRL